MRLRQGLTPQSVPGTASGRGLATWSTSIPASRSTCTCSRSPAICPGTPCAPRSSRTSAFSLSCAFCSALISSSLMARPSLLRFGAFNHLCDSLANASRSLWENPCWPPHEPSRLRADQRGWPGARPMRRRLGHVPSDPAGASTPCASGCRPARWRSGRARSRRRYASGRQGFRGAARLSWASRGMDPMLVTARYLI